MVELEEYDPKTCVTAGELREGGVAIPEDIPDTAWVPRLSMRIDLKRVPIAGDGSFRCDLSVEFSEPFRWSNP